jgi:hypothetical protein
MRVDLANLPERFQPVFVAGRRYWPVTLAAWELGVESRIVHSWIKARRHFTEGEVILDSAHRRPGPRWLIDETAMVRIRCLHASGQLTRANRCIVDGKEWYSVRRAAKELGVSKDTLWGWADKGKTSFGFTLDVHRPVRGGLYITKTCLKGLEATLKKVERPYRGRPRLLAEPQPGITG